jgi:hypothetical protein
VVEFIRLGLESVAQAGQSRQEAVLNFNNTSNVHSSGKGIIRRLAHVNMVVGVNGSLAAQLSTHKLNGTVGDDLVNVHAVEQTKKYVN